MSDYPAPLMPPGRVEPVPRRIRAVAGGITVVDSLRALYVWEWARYPQYYFPPDEVRTDLLVREGRFESGPFGQVEVFGLQCGDGVRPGGACIVADSSLPGLAGLVRFEWSAVDGWFEEDEPVHVHPRNPYCRVDALRSTRPVRIELEGILLAETGSPVMVFETGLPTRYYLNRTEVDFSRLVPSATVTECPYKGTTSGYWSALSGDRLHRDVAWSYGFPTGQLLPIAGLVAFYNERVDITVDGRQLARPRTHFG